MNINYKQNWKSIEANYKSHPQQKIKGKDKGKRDANTRTTHDVLSKRKPKPSA